MARRKGKLRDSPAWNLAAILAILVAISIPFAYHALMVEPKRLSICQGMSAEYHQYTPPDSTVEFEVCVGGDGHIKRVFADVENSRRKDGNFEKCNSYSGVLYVAGSDIDREGKAYMCVVDGEVSFWGFPS